MSTRWRNHIQSRHLPGGAQARAYRLCIMYLANLVWLTSMPSLNARRGFEVRPTAGLAVLIRRIRSRTSRFTQTRAEIIRGMSVSMTGTLMTHVETLDFSPTLEFSAATGGFCYHVQCSVHDSGST
jgi:hypothetical protein